MPDALLAVREALRPAVRRGPSLPQHRHRALRRRLLPASTWGKSTAPSPNSERRITRVLPAVPPPGEARHDWGDRRRKVRAAPRHAPGPHWKTRTACSPGAPEDIWNEHREARGRDLDITGLSPPSSESRGPQQWPMPEGGDRGTCSGSMPTAAASPPRTDARASSWRATARSPSHRRGLPARSQHRAAARPVARHEPHRPDRTAVRPRRRTLAM